MPLFARRGFDGVTTREIAAAAGVSEPILYRHFPSKEALFDEIEQFCLGAVVGRRERLGALPTDTATLVIGVHFLIDTIVRSTGFEPARHENLKRLILQSAISDGIFARRMIASQFVPLHDKLVACLEAAHAAGHLTPVDVPHSLRVLMVHHMAAMTSAYRLAVPPLLEYGTDDLGVLVDRITRLALRVLGLTDAAVTSFYTPAAWALWRN